MLYFKGPVRFYNNERKASFVLKQFQNGEWVKIGEYNSLYNHLDLSLGSPIKWVSSDDIEISKFRYIINENKPR